MELLERLLGKYLDALDRIAELEVQVKELDEAAESFSRLHGRAQAECAELKARLRELESRQVPGREQVKPSDEQSSPIREQEPPFQERSPKFGEQAAPSAPAEQPAVEPPDVHGAVAGAPDADLRVRFWSKVDRSGGVDTCWLWVGAIDSTGYGAIKVNGYKEGAHRVAYRLERGEIPDGVDIKQTCQERRCCNPRHLLPVTRQVSVAMMRQEQRKQAAETEREVIRLPRGQMKCTRCGAMKPMRWFAKLDGAYTGLCTVCHLKSEEDKERAKAVGAEQAPQVKRGRPKRPLVELTQHERICERCRRVVNTRQTPWYAGACFDCWKPAERGSFSGEWRKVRQAEDRARRKQEAVSC